MGVDGDRLGRNHRSGRWSAAAKQDRAGILGLGGDDPVGAVIEGVEPPQEVGTKWNEVGLGDDQSVCERRLPPRLGETVEAVGAVHRIDESDDPRQMQ